VKYMTNEGRDVEDLVVKAIGHPERKNILRIVGGYSEGVNYSGILGESGLSTGRLNYHLGELAGFLERDEERKYRLSELGRKAVATLEFIKKDLDISVLEGLNDKRAERLKRIRRNQDVGFYVGALVLASIPVLFGYFAWVEADQVLVTFTLVSAVTAAGLIYLMNRSRKRNPERILWLIEWLEWRLLRGYREGPQNQ
jgi:hypothetical protein